MDYLKLAKMADRLLGKFGPPQKLAWRQKTRGTYDPEKGTTIDTVVTQQVNGVTLAFDRKYIDGTNIKNSDLRVLISPLNAAGAVHAVSPKQGDQLVIAGEVWELIANSPLNPAGIPCLHDMQARQR